MTMYCIACIAPRLCHAHYVAILRQLFVHVARTACGFRQVTVEVLRRSYRTCAVAPTRPELPNLNLKSTELKTHAGAVDFGLQQLLFSRWTNIKEAKG